MTSFGPNSRSSKKHKTRKMKGKKDSPPSLGEKILYRVVNDLNYGPISQITVGTAYPLGPAMKEEIPEVREAVRLLSTRKILIAHGEKNITKKISSSLILPYLLFSLFLLFKEMPTLPYRLPLRSL
jgi:hypothetical protein